MENGHEWKSKYKAEVSSLPTPNLVIGCPVKKNVSALPVELYRIRKLKGNFQEHKTLFYSIETNACTPEIFFGTMLKRDCRALVSYSPLFGSMFIRSLSTNAFLSLVIQIHPATSSI